MIDIYIHYYSLSVFQMNYKKYLIAIILLVLPAIVISSVAINEVGHIMRQKPVFALTSSSDSSDSVHISKITTNSYTISSGSSSIGTFGTTYTIFGNVSSIKNASGL